MKQTISQGLSPNQIQKLVLIRSSIINIQDSPEFGKLDYYPDLTLGDAVQAIEELIIECQREEPPKPVMRLTIRRRFSFTELLGKTMLASFFLCGIFACGALFSNGLKEINPTRFSVVDNIDWESLGEVATGLSMASLAVSGVSALGIAANQIKE